MNASLSARRAQYHVDGVLLLDKPRGYTSNQALQRAKRLLAASKAGHTGSLDPIATGVLPLCFGEATKLSQFLLDADKRYRAVFQLGVTTTTFDSEGEVLNARPVAVDGRSLERVLADFRGEIEQIPPMYSALKRDGRPLYEWARNGIELERTPRRVRISELTVRSLAGARLGCGAHVAELRRLGVGDLDVDHAVTLEALEGMPDPQTRARSLLPADRVLIAIPDVRLTTLATHYLLRGQPVSARHDHGPGWVRLYDAQDRF